LVAVTKIVPLLAEPFVETMMFAVPAPEVIVHPDGNNQLYEVAPGTAAML